MKNQKHIKRKATLALVLATLIIFAIPINFAFAATRVDITVNANSVISTNKLSLGFELCSDASQFRSSSTLRSLAQDANFKFVRIINNFAEPCTYWSQSSKTGTFSWTKIDDIVERIFDMGGQPIITLGFYNWNQDKLQVPSGMTISSTTRLPNPAQWAAYTAEWVKHFKNAGLPVKYYEIVNEPYHYFGWYGDQPRLGYYMQLYNAAATAMRAQNPNVQLSTDASTNKAVLSYFISNGEKLNFISFHRYGANVMSASDAEIISNAETKYLVTTTSIYGPKDAVQVYKKAKGIELPIIMSEGNVNSAYSSGTDPRTRQMLGAVYTALSAKAFILNGVSASVYHNLASSGTDGVGMINRDNNKPWYPYYAQKMISNNLAVGNSLVYSTSTSEGTTSLAWINNGKINVLIINKVNQARTVYVNGLQSQMNYLKIDNTISWSNPQVQTGTISSATPINLNGYAVALLQSNGPSGSGSSESILTDNFESGDFTKWEGISGTSGETMQVVNWQPYQGTYHSRFTTDGDGGWEQAYCYKSVNCEEIYIRGYFNVPAGLPLSDNEDRFYFMRLMANSQNLAGVGVRRNNGDDRWVLYARDGSNWKVIIDDTNSPVTTDRWYRLELHWKKDAQQGVAQMFVNGQKILEITNANTAYFGNVNEINFGILGTMDVQNRLYVYGDNFAADYTYIGP